MSRRPPASSRANPLFPFTTLFRPEIRAHVLGEILVHLAQEHIGAAAGGGVGHQGDVVDGIALGEGHAAARDERRGGGGSSNAPESGFHLFPPVLSRWHLVQNYARKTVGLRQCCCVIYPKFILDARKSTL